VVSLVGERITLWQSVERALGYGASMLEAGTGFLQYFTHHNRCCVHDRIAETIVVSERDAEPGLNSSAQSSELWLHWALITDCCNCERSERSAARLGLA